MSGEMMKLEDVDGFDYESEYEDDDGDSGGILAGTTRIKFTNSYDWVKVGSNEKLPAGLELLVAKVERVLIRFDDNNVPETEIIPPGQKFPNMREKNDKAPKSEWRKNPYTGAMEGPWQAQHVLFLLDEETFDRYSWPAPCTTIGATLCVEDLLTKIRFKRKILGVPVDPIVTLSNRHMKTRYSKEGRQRPHLVIKRWVRIGGGPALQAGLEPKQLPASPPTVPATSAVRAPVGPKPATTGEQLDASAKASKPIEAPPTRTDLDDALPF